MVSLLFLFLKFQCAKPPKQGDQAVDDEAAIDVYHYGQGHSPIAHPDSSLIIKIYP